MKRSFFLSILIISVYTGVLYGQSFDWNVRGGLNIMESKSSDKDISLLYHAGIQAGVRISYFAIYGEVVYSMNENQQYGGDPVGYVIPAINIKRYVKKFLFAEFGGGFLVIAGDSGVDPESLNPNNKPFALAGFGTAFSNFELSLRAMSRSSYGIIQVTAAVKF